jgi:iron(III) transport system substrate-binding protein
MQVRDIMSKIRWLVPVAALLACVAAKAAPESLFAYVTFDEEIAQKYIAAFEKDSGVKVEFVRLSTGEATARLEAEKANPQASIWLGGVGIGHAEMKEKGITTPYLSPAAAKVPANFRDKENYWTGLYVGVLTFGVNKASLQKKNLPTPATWKDLLDPKWKGQIQIPNPGTSGTSYNLLTALIQRDGEGPAMDYFSQLHKNIAQYTRSGQAPVKNAALGEVALGVGYSHDILKLIYETKAPLEIVYPKDGTGYELASVSLIKGGKQQDLAKKLYDWSFSQKANQILADNYISPILKTNVTMKKEATLPKGQKLVDVPADWAGKNKQRLVELWNEKVNH